MNGRRKEASIVRLEGLDAKASAKDIRDFFPGLQIFTCGVMILGGPHREAFIAFKSESEARSAVRRSGYLLKGSKVLIYLSSISELESKLQYFREKKTHSVGEALSRIEESSEAPPIVFTLTSPLRDPRTASASFLKISSPPISSGDLQTFDKPRDWETHPHTVPNRCVQTFDKLCDPRTAPIVKGSSQMRDRPRDPRTIPAISDCPQTCDELPVRSSPDVSSGFLQTSDKSHSPPKYNALVPSQCPPICDEYTTFSTGGYVPNSDEPQTSDILQNAFLLGVRTALESLQPCQSEQQEVVSQNGRQEDRGTIHLETKTSAPGYVRLFGLPASITRQDIICFFKGLKVEEVVTNMKLEHRYVCLVKFDNKRDADDALQFNNQYMGPVCVEVRKATEVLWNLAMEECRNSHSKKMRESLTDTANRKLKLRSEDEEEGKPPKKAKQHGPKEEYIVKVSNLPVLTTKTDLIQIFELYNMSRSQILHLLDKYRNRTDTAFLIFNRKEDYEHAMTCDDLPVKSGRITVSAISRPEMNDMIWKNQRVENRSKKTPHTKKEILEKKLHDRTKTCLLVQNMPENMKETLMLKLLHKYKVPEDNVITLNDDGKASCTAMVPFKSLKFVSMAEKLSQDLLGENAIITRITAKQMNIFASEGLH